MLAHTYGMRALAMVLKLSLKQFFFLCISIQKMEVLQNCFLALIGQCTEK